jgi:serine acetyltransferase
LSDGKQAENRASRPARPISRASADAFVGPGVTVDEGAIIEAGAVVLKDVKPWMIVSENTARD